MVFESCNSCDDGFRLSGGFNSILDKEIYSCVDIDECNDGTDTCDVDNAACANTVGNYTCTCNAGYAGNGETCNDIDECNDGTDTCDTNAICTNNDGSYSCACKPSFTGNGETCSAWEWEDIYNITEDSQGAATATRFVVGCVGAPCSTLDTVKNKNTGCAAILKWEDTEKYVCAMVCEDATCEEIDDAEITRVRRLDLDGKSNLKFLLIGPRGPTS